MVRPPATDALRLILAVVPWIVDHPGATLDEVSARFGKTEEELLAAIEIISFVGVPPYSPDTLIEMWIDEGRIWINYADYFSKPLRLSTRQALKLLSSADGLKSIPGIDPEGALHSAFDKVAAVVGADDGGLEVDLGTPASDVIETLRTAAAAGTEVEMEYFSFGRNVATSRVVAPWRVYADGGQWYVSGWCTSADGERTFRVDRISAIVDTERASDHRPEGTVEAGVRFRPTGGEPTITLDLDRPARWVVESVPCSEVIERPDGRLRATLAVSAVPWLERLLLQIGPHATVVDTTVPDGETLRARAAVRLLEIYAK